MGRGINILNFMIYYLKCLNIQDNMIHTQRNKASNRNCLRSCPNVKFDRLFQGDIVSIFKDLRETMLNEVRKSLMIMCHQIETISKEREIIKKKKKQLENWSSRFGKLDN